MKLFASLPDVFALREAEESLPGQLRKLRIFASQVAVQGIELREPFPECPLARAQLHLDLVECDRFTLSHPLF